MAKCSLVALAACILLVWCNNDAQLRKILLCLVLPVLWEASQRKCICFLLVALMHFSFSGCYTMSSPSQLGRKRAEKCTLRRVGRDCGCWQCGKHLHSKRIMARSYSLGALLRSMPPRLHLHAFWIVTTIRCRVHALQCSSDWKRQLTGTFALWHCHTAARSHLLCAKLLDRRRRGSDCIATSVFSTPLVRLGMISVLAACPAQLGHPFCVNHALSTNIKASFYIGGGSLRK